MGVFQVGVEILNICFFIFSVYNMLAAGCEFRSYRGGHRFIRAFRARTAYQRFFTLMQCEKDIYRADLGKLTYLGYAGVLAVTATGILAGIGSGYMFLSGKFELADVLICLWAVFGSGLGIAAVILQGLDSLLNRFLR